MKTHLSVMGTGDKMTRGDVYTVYTSHGPAKFIVIKVNSRFILTVRPYTRLWAAAYVLETWWEIKKRRMRNAWRRG